MSIWIEIMGCLAGLLTSGSYVPQLIKLLVEKNAHGVSMQTYGCAFIGSTIWVLYGILNASIALVLFNGFNMLAAIVILFLLIKCMGKPNGSINPLPK